MSGVQNLQKPNVTATFDEKRRIIYVTYRGVLDTEPTLDYYHWMAREISPLVSSVRGAIFDFRGVIKFRPSNALTVLHASRNLHQQVDLSHIPMALLTKDVYQEHMVRIAANMTPQTINKRVVQTEAAALAFIDEWNASHA